MTKKISTVGHRKKTDGFIEEKKMSHGQLVINIVNACSNPILQQAFLSMYTEQHGTLPWNILSLLINLELFATSIGFLRSGIFFILT